LYFGRDTSLNFEGHGAVCRPMDSGGSGSTNCEIRTREYIFFRYSSVRTRVLVW
jgi:hypothetical protein